MKAFSKRGSSVLDAPEEMYAPGAVDAPWAKVGPATREPAPAGALQRGYAERATAEIDAEPEVDERPYVPVRGQLRFRFRGIVKTVAGRVVLGVAALVVLCVVVGGAVVARNYLLHDARFVIPSSDQIETVGNVHLTRAQLLSVFGEDVERNIFKVPLAERRADLERLPWVQHATVMRLLPNTLRVQVVERTPVAFVRQGSSIGLVDASGVLLDMPSSDAGDPRYSFPVLTGLSAADPLSMRAARMEIYRRFMKDLDSSGEKITDNLSEVDVSSPEDVKAMIPSGGSDILVHFGDEDFLERYRHFEQHLPEWKQQYPKLASADMRYDRQVVLEMAPGTSVPAIIASNGDAPAKPEVKAEDYAAVPPAKAPAKPVAKPVAKAPETPAVAKVPAPVEGRTLHGATAKPVSVASGKTSAANAKMFAALIAARQQQEAKSAGSGQGPR
jgi:cell division protein FtsQ